MCDVIAFVTADSFGAHEVAHCLLLAVDLTEGPVHIPLPVDFITVDLELRKQDRELSPEHMGKCHTAF